MKRFLPLLLVLFVAPAAMAQTSTLDSLKTSTAALFADIDATVAFFQAEVGVLETELAGIDAQYQSQIDQLTSTYEAEISDLNATITALRTDNANLQQTLATYDAVIDEVLASQGKKMGLLKQLRQ